MKKDCAFARGLVPMAAAAALWLLGPWASARAFDLDPNEIRGKSSKQSVTVLQNRYFLKSLRPEVGLMVGTILDEAYLNTTTLGVRTGMFFSEWVGVEIGLLRTIVSDSDDRKALNKLRYRPLNSEQPSDGTETEVVVSPDPEVNAIQKVIDLTGIFAPFYGKLNLLDRWIIYTDLYLSAGVSRLETDQGDKTALSIGLGERFYIGKSWSIRVDFKDRIFSERRAGEETRKHSYSVDLGASFFFR